MTFGIGALFGLVVGGSIVGLILSEMHKLHIAIAEERVKRAFRDCGKLSKKIHKQRLMIKVLKENQVPKTKKTYTQQTTISH